MKQTSKKKTAKKGSAPKNAVKKNNTAPKKKEDKKPDSSALIHQILPYIFVLSALFIALCLILVSIVGKTDAMGSVGKFINGFFCGFFGGGAFLVPLLLLYLAFAWRKSIDNEQ